MNKSSVDGSAAAGCANHVAEGLCLPQIHVAFCLAGKIRHLKCKILLTVQLWTPIKIQTTFRYGGVISDRARTGNDTASSPVYGFQPNTDCSAPGFFDGRMVQGSQLWSIDGGECHAGQKLLKLVVKSSFWRNAIAF